MAGSICLGYWRRAVLGHSLCTETLCNLTPRPKPTRVKQRTSVNHRSRARLGANVRPTIEAHGRQNFEEATDDCNLKGGDTGCSGKTLRVVSRIDRYDLSLG